MDLFSRLEPQVSVSPAASPRSPRSKDAALTRVAAAAAGASSLEDVLELAAEEAREAIGAASLSVSRYDHSKERIDTLLNVGDLGPGEKRWPEDESFPMAEFHLVAGLIENRRSYFNDISDADCDPVAAALLRRLGKASEVGVAILVEDEVWGEVWAARRPDQPPFRAEDAEFLEAVSGQIGVAIGRAELFSRVSRLAYEDALTGLPNRRAFDERAQRAFDRAKGAISLLICDLDGLKEINDTAGHDAGDHALQSASRALVSAAAGHPGAFVARLAGDEFCVLLEDRELAAALEIGRKAVDELRAKTGGHRTLSCGAAQASPSSSAGPSSLLKDADAALYLAKRKGGGRVCSAGRSHGIEMSASERTLGPAVDLRWLSEVVDRLVADLDHRLAGASPLDRLETVAEVFTRAGEFASWTISFVGPERTQIKDVSLGDNRQLNGEAVRVDSGARVYFLADYPASETLIRAGCASLFVDRADWSSDPAERELLAELGFDSMVGAAAGGDDGVYLLELYGDRRTTSPRSFASLLRLSAQAAVLPSVPSHASLSVRSPGKSMSTPPAARQRTS